MVGRGKGGWVRTFSGLLLFVGAGFFAWTIAHRPLEHAKLESFVQDLHRARDESRLSYQLYAYRFFHFSEESFHGKSWERVHSELQRQGARVLNDWGDGIVYELPGCDFELPDRTPLQARLTLWRKGISPTVSNPVDFRVGSLTANFELPPASFKDIAAKFPPGTAVAQVFRRPRLIQAAERFPELTSFAFRYAAEIPTTVNPGAFEVQFTLSPKPSSGRAEFDYRVESMLEPRSAKLVSWLPFRLSTSRDRLGAITESGESVLRWMERGSFGLRKTGLVQPPDSPVAAIAYGIHDIRTLPATTASLRVNSSAKSVDWQDLGRFKGLKSLVVEGVLSDADVRDIVNLKGLKTLTVSITDGKSCRLLSGMSDLEGLTLACSTASETDLMELTKMPKLRELCITRSFRTPHPFGDRFMTGLANLRGLEKLWLIPPGDFSESGLAALSRLPVLKELWITMSGAKGGAAPIAECPSLERLGLFEAKTTQTELRALSRSPKLRNLTFSLVEGLDEPATLELSRLKNLESVHFLRCKGMTVQRLLKLKAKLKGSFDEF